MLRYTNYKRFSRLQLPGILSDIDGVVYRGAFPIKGSDRVIKSIFKPFYHPLRQ